VRSSCSWILHVSQHLRARVSCVRRPSSLSPVASQDLRECHESHRRAWRAVVSPPPPPLSARDHQRTVIAHSTRLITRTACRRVATLIDRHHGARDRLAHLGVVGIKLFSLRAHDHTNARLDTLTPSCTTRDNSCNLSCKTDSDPIQQHTITLCDNVTSSPTRTLRMYALVNLGSSSIALLQSFNACHTPALRAHAYRRTSGYARSLNNAAALLVCV
jgi:hypothetical protein